ncbi:MAG TPA: UTRA domain-containing protein, partial [Burkholderiaceae bacterium]
RTSSLATGSMHRKLKEAGVQFASAECTVSASLADLRQAELLEVPVAAALLYMMWVIRDQDRRVVQYQLLHARPDVYMLYTELGASGS